MQLHQINMQYDPHQDRLLVRVSTKEKLEYQFWFTRRLTRALWPALMQQLSKVNTAQAPTTEAREAVTAFRREKALGEALFGTQFEGEENRPALSAPMLASNIRMAVLPEGRHEIHIAPNEGTGFRMQLGDNLLHAFSRLMQDALKKSGWDLELREDAGAAQQTKPLPANRALN